MHRYPRYSRNLPRFHKCRRAGNCSLKVAHDRSKAGLGGRRRMGVVLSGHAVQLRAAFGTSPAARTINGAADLFGDKFVVPPHCAARRRTTQENQSYGCLHPLGLEVVPQDGKGRVHFADGRQGSSRFSVFLPSVLRQNSWRRVSRSISKNVTPCQARHSGPSIDRATNVRPLSECKSRGQWRTDQSVQRYEKSARGSRLFGAASANARVDRHFRTTCRGSHPWNQPRLCLHRRLKCQYILHLFAHSDVVASRSGVPCYSM